MSQPCFPRADTLVYPRSTFIPYKKLIYHTCKVYAGKNASLFSASLLTAAQLRKWCMKPCSRRVILKDTQAHRNYRISIGRASRFPTVGTILLLSHHYHFYSYAENQSFAQFTKRTYIVPLLCVGCVWQPPIYEHDDDDDDDDDLKLGLLVERARWFVSKPGHL